jgi:hypothetical protein
VHASEWALIVLVYWEWIGSLAGDNVRVLKSARPLFLGFWSLVFTSCVSAYVHASSRQG